MDELYEEVRQVLSARAQIALTLSEEVIWGGPFAALRPFELEEHSSFSIALVPTRFRATACFVPDTFAGYLMRKMRDNLVLDIEPWKSFIGDVKERCAVSIQLDGRPADVEDVQSTAWQRIEIDCTVGFAGSDSIDGRRRAFTDAAGTCLSLVLLALDSDTSGEDSSSEGDLEGTVTQTRMTRYERSAVNRLRCIQFWGTSCWVCDFDFRSTYGALGEGFIEVHHLQPLANYSTPHAVDPKRELVPLCSNCHSMVHRDHVLSPMHPRALRELIGKPPKQWPSPLQ